MYDLHDFDLSDLFKIRDAMDILERYVLAEGVMYAEVENEIARIEDAELAERLEAEDAANNC
jgi:hypothetical protein